MTSPAAEIPQPVTQQSPWIERQLLLAIPLLVLIAYLPALRTEFIWDDDDYVTDNLTLRTAEGLRDIWLMPRASPQFTRSCSRRSGCGSAQSRFR